MDGPKLSQAEYSARVEHTIRAHLPYMLSVTQRIGTAILEGASEETLRLINVPVNAALFGALTTLAASAYPPKEKADEGPESNESR